VAVSRAASWSDARGTELLGRAAGLVLLWSVLHVHAARSVVIDVVGSAPHPAGEAAFVEHHETGVDADAVEPGAVRAAGSGAVDPVRLTVGTTERGTDLDRAHGTSAAVSRDVRLLLLCVALVVPQVALGLPMRALGAPSIQRHVRVGDAIRAPDRTARDGSLLGRDAHGVQLPSAHHMGLDAGQHLGQHRRSLRLQLSVEPAQLGAVLWRRLASRHAPSTTAHQLRAVLHLSRYPGWYGCQCR